MKTITIKQDVDNMVAAALAAGKHIIVESDPVRQHYLREHPNVCRQVLRYTQMYSIHPHPCGCKATPRAPKRQVLGVQSLCCGVTQAAESECVLCGAEVTK